MLKVKKIYSAKEAKDLWDADQILYTEVAHGYPCCDLPQDIS